MNNAREKLNASYLNGSLFLAGVVGWLAQSWLLFLLALLVLLGLNLYLQEIRLLKKDTRSQGRR